MLATSASNQRPQHNPPQHGPGPSAPFEMSAVMDDASSTTKKARNLYRENRKVYTRKDGDGKEEFRIEEVLEDGKYKLQRGDNKAEGVLNDVFAEEDLSEEPCG